MAQVHLATHFKSMYYGFLARTTQYIFRRAEIQIMTSLSIASDANGGLSPKIVVVVERSRERMRNLVKENVVYFGSPLVLEMDDQVLAHLDGLAGVIAESGAGDGIVCFKGCTVANPTRPWTRNISFGLDVVHPKSIHMFGNTHLIFVYIKQIWWINRYTCMVFSGWRFCSWWF
jgi:hypothetical protein